MVELSLAGDDASLGQKAALRFFRSLKKAQSVFTMFRPIRAIDFRPESARIPPTKKGLHHPKKTAKAKPYLATLNLDNLFNPIPVNPLIIDKTGDNKLKKQNGKNAKVETPRVLAAKAPATPQGIK